MREPKTAENYKMYQQVEAEIKFVSKISEHKLGKLHTETEEDKDPKHMR